MGESYLEKNIYKTIRIATVGYQKKYRDVLMKLFSVKAKEGIVRLNVEGVACAPVERLPALAALYNISFYDTVEELCEHLDGLDTVFDLSENAEYIEKIRGCAKGKTSVVGGETLLLFQHTELDPEKLALKPCDLVRAMGFFNTVVEQSEDEYWFVDEDGIVFDANRAVLDRPRDLRFEGEGDVIINRKIKYAGRKNNVITRCFGTSRRIDEILSEVGEDGRLHFFGITAYPIYTKDWKTQAVLLCRRDITNTYAMMRNVQQDEKIAAVGQLSAFLAHEIRNPLFAIGGFARSVLQNPDLPEGDQKKVQIIVNESARLEGLLKVILNFAHSDKTDESEFDLNEILQAALRFYQSEFEAKGGVVRVNLTENLPFVIGNAEVLKQCIMSGLSNGVEAMPEGGVLAVRTALTADNWVLMEIVDTGEGIPPDVMEHLFNPFFTTKIDRNGLGLSMIKKNMEDMGGKVRLRSKKGRGTVLSMYLPPAFVQVEKPLSKSMRQQMREQTATLHYGVSGEHGK